MTAKDSFNILYDEMFDLGYADDDFSNEMHMSLSEIFDTNTPMQNNVLAFLFRELVAAGQSTLSNFWIDVHVIARVTDYTESEVRAAIRCLVKKRIVSVSPSMRNDLDSTFNSLNMKFSKHLVNMTY